MIPVALAARFLPYKWIALAALLAIMAAWGGLGWYGKSAAQKELADYQRDAARALAVQLAENQRLSEQQARDSAATSAAYQKGKRDVAQAFQPALADLQMLRSLYAGGATAGLRRPSTDPDAVPGPADPAGGPDATACTDRPAEIIAAAHRVAEDLESCAGYLTQLTSLQQWVRDVANRSAP